MGTGMVTERSDQVINQRIPVQLPTRMCTLNCIYLAITFVNDMPKRKLDVWVHFTRNEATAGCRGSALYITHVIHDNDYHV